MDRPVAKSMDSQIENGLKVIGSFTITAILAPLIVTSFVLVGLPLSVLNAYIVNKMWLWFVLPQFGWPVPRLIVTFGLLLMFNHLVYSYSKDDRKLTDRFVTNLVSMLVVWGMAAVTHWLMVR